MIKSLLKSSWVLLVALAWLTSSVSYAATEIWPITDASQYPLGYAQTSLAILTGGTNDQGGFVTTNILYKYNADSNGIATATNLVVGTYLWSVTWPVGTVTPIQFTIANAHSTNYISQNNTTGPYYPGSGASYSMTASDARYPSIAGTNITFNLTNGQIQINAAGGGSGGIATNNGMGWNTTLANSTINGGSVSNSSVITSNFTTQNALFIPTNTYNSIVGGVTNISGVGTNNNNYAVLTYKAGFPHLKKGDQFNFNTVDQYWIVDITNLSGTVDSVCVHPPMLHTYAAPTNLFVSPAAAQWTDNNGNYGMSIGGDGDIQLYGFYGNVQFNSAGLTFANASRSSRISVQDNGDGFGPYLWLGGAATISGNPNAFAQLCIYPTAPRGSLVVMPNGVVSVLGGFTNNSGSTISFNVPIVANGSNINNIWLSNILTNGITAATSGQVLGVSAGHLAFVTPSGGANFVSSQITLGTSSSFTVPHGLGAVPSKVRVVLVLQIDDSITGFTTGQEIDISGSWNTDDNAPEFTVVSDSVNVYVYLNEDFGSFQNVAFNSPNGYNQLASASNVKLKVYASAP